MEAQDIKGDAPRMCGAGVFSKITHDLAFEPSNLPFSTVFTVQAAARLDELCPGECEDCELRKA